MGHLSHRIMPRLGKAFFLFCLAAVALAQESSIPTPQAPGANLAQMAHITLTITQKTKLKTYLALTLEQQTLGLSNIKDEQFSRQEAMLFVYSEVGPRRFWMKQTFFDLDILFLDEQGKITAMALGMEAHPGADPRFIPTTPAYKAQYVLETKAGIFAWRVGQELLTTPQRKFLAKKLVP